MCGRSNESTSLPEPSGPIDERFVYRLTAEGKKALEESERSNGKPAYSKTRCTSEVAEALASEARCESKGQRRRQARQRGVRLGTVGPFSFSARPGGRSVRAGFTLIR